MTVMTMMKEMTTSVEARTDCITDIYDTDTAYKHQYIDDISLSSSSSFSYYQIISDEEEKEKEKNNTTHENHSNADKNDNEVDGKYYTHIILPSDTMQGICLQYKITQTKMRQINQFSGSSLLLAPKRLYIPKRPGVVVREQNSDTDEFKIHSIMADFEFLNSKEVRAYLDLNEWDVHKTLHVIKDDKRWEDHHCGRQSYNACRQEWESNYVPPSLLAIENPTGQSEHIPVLVVGMPVDLSLQKLYAEGNMKRTMAMHGTAEFGIEMKDMSPMSSQ